MSKPRSAATARASATIASLRQCCAGMAPVPVAPQQRGLEPVHELLDLRAHVRVDVALLVGVVGMTPVEQRVVAPEHVTAAAHGIGQLGRDVTLGAEMHRGSLRHRAVPPAEAVVVLRDVHQVAHTRIVEQLRVVVGVEAIERQLVDEVVERAARRVLTVPRDHLGQRARGVQHHVGLGLEKRPVPVGVLVHRREGGHGRDVRVHEHAVPALVEPPRFAHRGGRYSAAAERMGARARTGGARAGIKTPAGSRLSRRRSGRGDRGTRP